MTSRKLFLRFRSIAQSTTLKPRGGGAVDAAGGAACTGGEPPAGRVLPDDIAVGSVAGWLDVSGGADVC